MLASIQVYFVKKQKHKVCFLKIIDYDEFKHLSGFEVSEEKDSWHNYFFKKDNQDKEVYCTDQEFLV